MKVVLVDDESYALEMLRTELEKINGLEIIGAFENSEEFLSRIDDLKPDVAFLDIKMADYSGFDIFDILSERNLMVDIVFVTSYDKYAVKAFEIAASDYIVKPVTHDRLLRCISRLKPMVEQRPPYKDSIEIQCFKSFFILMNGNALRINWRTKKSEELILYLLSIAGNYVTREKLASELWTEKDRITGLSNLRVAKFYAKKNLSDHGLNNLIIEDHDGMKLNIDNIKCDAFEFNEIYKNFNSGTFNEKELCRAIGLYDGMFLEDKYFPWLADIQQQYDIKYFYLIKNLVKYYQSKADKENELFYQKKLMLYFDEFK